ncbi:serine hydrolase domain-containing protein [Yeosuana sp. MJ-SS3]|uniref:Serine hydrolase domain-containing protein n=1 Tax=Gilvirhabdus luticola TaxID=3079858 RepID=A0ABU3U4U3_9FLAO|nr:serine hydrolase domain-containing protein [Yeosuana sp. MJ-SS3]MDU8885381.1 serine hydrolase domain-containing protein [Yeosuana sp. MJ-SS3]
MKKLISLLLFINLSFGFGQSLGSLQDEKIKTAKEIAEAFLNKNNIPGMAISVSKNGKIIWSEGFGYSNIELKTEVSPSETQFRIASISKPITAAALAKLVDDRKLDFDESIYTYIPEFPKKKFDFTVRQVAGHIAGIRHYNGQEFILNKKMTIVEGLDIFKDDPLKFKPGSDFSYSTYGWNLLSVVVQNAAQTPFNDYMQETIFKPLKMDYTTLDLSDSNMPNRTQFYRKTYANKIVLGPTVSNEHKVAGGGFLSASEDLVKFGNEIISPEILSEASLKELVTPLTLDSGESTNYGIGFGIGKTKKETSIYGHTGGGVGASTLLRMYPEENIVISILTNLSQAPIRDIGEELELIFID